MNTFEKHCKEMVADGYRKPQPANTGMSLTGVVITVIVILIIVAILF